MKKYMSLLLVMVITLPAIIPQHAVAQKLNRDLSVEFLLATELYILKNEANTRTFKTSRGEPVTFEKLVKKSWPNKVVLKIDEDEYNELENQNKQFYTTIMNYNVGKNGGKKGSFHGIIIQQGKTGRYEKRMVNWMFIDFNAIRDFEKAERLVYAVTNIKDQIENYNDSSIREDNMYKTAGYFDYLESNTLYIREDNLDESIPSRDEIDEIYKHNFELVSQEEWEDVIQQKRENALYLECIQDRYYTAVGVYEAETGKMILSSFPWTGEDWKLDKSFFEKMFE